MIKNKKGQTAFTVLIVLIIVTVMWVGGLSKWIGETGSDMVTSNGLTGFDAWFYSNINLVIGISIIISFFTLARFGLG